MAEGCLELKNIRKQYKNFALENLSFTFEKGKCYYLKGENGAGKTTLFNIIANFIFPDSGKVLFWGKEMKGNEAYIKNRFSFIPNYIALPAHATPKFLSNMYKSMYRKFDKKVFEKHLANMGIENTTQKLEEMSDGMKKKVLISLELSYFPEILLADEICNNLDKDTVSYCLDCMERLRAEKQSLLLFSSHSEEEIMKLSPTVIQMSKGRFM